MVSFFLGFLVGFVVCFTILSWSNRSDRREMEDSFNPDYAPMNDKDQAHFDKSEREVKQSNTDMNRDQDTMDSLKKEKREHVTWEELKTRRDEDRAKFERLFYDD